ncbi:IS66 Orf2 like protein [Oxobacter pfennigii]|uniref:IS66 Orf2 like protein n=1 Tax=Oxobacter pfennigii TaxID=36849 RepID=A0A0P8WF20_9CLOT|nr:IS66 family insertion sequence element accessory protein TnpB [Oxobacter pfennigii]KPU46390.1 IS66 Orf2 like protein [Oxobacter pfennigii]
MLNDALGLERIYIACGYSDLRRGIDGFAGMIQQQFKLDPFKPGTLFLFCGRKTDRIKGLLWEGDGFLLLYKRLEAGKFQWPRNEEEVKSITMQQYKWLMEGISIEQKKAIKILTPKQAL